ncbi:hypothetical protein IMG5_179630 [Ichthyophthirius multifiliis]|uniref:EF-hand domain-containing protein n=1 Tax=Ichthyophthirius multifiliis TaxID=5932 RepID=G0R2N3_ICHMU|nr:hypothetical protein IMG5_179630 [Ichthyophthirius multifiliis]EGR28272.1 hypothetical protein IMG5_179630 [Ichthyophthirius multifiliis]|eukprot:XP_004027617.1 hypothetical protein IMG5_179630 [Ichthyophthirius multifiliis]
MEQNNKKPDKKPLKLKDLPPTLRQKYKDHPLFANEQRNKPRIALDQDELKQFKEDKIKSIEEKVEEYQLQPTEYKALDRVFKLFYEERLTNEKKMDKTNNSLLIQNQSTEEAQKQHKQNEINKQYFTSREIETVLAKMHMNLTKSEIDLMLWEVDSNLDKKIDYKEFINMYKRCIMKNSDLEPKSLFHMAQFLMYCKTEENKFTVTVEDTLELLYVRMGRNKLDEEIKAIFGEDEKTNDGQEKQISFCQYLEKINQRAIEQRKEKLQNKKIMFSYKKSDETSIIH